jgi:DNA gyrase subunit A
MAVSELRVMGRATQGVRLINLKNGDTIAAVTKVKKDEDAIDDEDIEDIDATVVDSTAADENLNNDKPSSDEEE